MYRWTSTGPLNAVGTVSAGMLVAGVVTLAWWVRHRRSAGVAAAPTGPATAVPTSH